MKYQGKILTFEPIGECLVEKNFYSKKNNVYLVRTQTGRYVIKKYSAHNSSAREEYMLKTLKGRGVSIPELIYSCEDYIILEYIDGSTLLDEFSSAEKNHTNIDGLAFRFIVWLKSFYHGVKDANGFQTIIGDVNFRNFITNDKFYGIDFEDCRRGDIEEDAGRICAYFICYIPAFTDWKIQMAGNLFKMLTCELSLDPDYVKCKFYEELSSIEKRRNLYIPEGIAGKVFDK